MLIWSACLGFGAAVRGWSGGRDWVDHGAVLVPAGVCGGLWGDGSLAAAKPATCRSVVFRISFSSGLQHGSLLARRVSGQKAWLKPTASKHCHQGGGLEGAPAVGEEGSCRGFRGRRIQHFSLNTYLCQKLSILSHKDVRFTCAQSIITDFHHFIFFPLFNILHE